MEINVWMNIKFILSKASTIWYPGGMYNLENNNLSLNIGEK